LFDLVSFLRILVFSVIYGGIEYKYVNREEAEWTKKIPGFYEKPLWQKYTPYHVLFLLPLFVVVSFTFSLSAWFANVVFAALAEDIFYFVWRKRWVRKGEWTAKLFGSFTLGKYAFPLWWFLAAVIITALYLLPTP
jgi:hypothetical protein